MQQEFVRDSFTDLSAKVFWHLGNLPDSIQETEAPTGDSQPILSIEVSSGCSPAMAQ